MEEDWIFLRAWHRNSSSCSLDYHQDFSAYLTRKPWAMREADYEKLKEKFAMIQRRIDHFVTLHVYDQKADNGKRFARLTEYYRLREAYGRAMRYACDLTLNENLDIMECRLKDIRDLEQRVLGGPYPFWDSVKSIFSCSG